MAKSMPPILPSSEPYNPLRRAADGGAVPSLLELARAFLVIGALAFGGQGGLLALLSRDVVERRGWVEETEITEAYTYVQLLPGAVVVQVVAYLGYRMRGWRGAFVVTISFLLPSVVAMLSLAAAYRRVAAIAGVPAALNGLTAAVVGLIALAAYKQARKTVQDALGVILAVVVCAASIWRHVNPAVLVVAAGLIGIVHELTRKKDATINTTINKTIEEAGGGTGAAKR
jgi:chromate transporter